MINKITRYLIIPKRKLKIIANKYINREFGISVIKLISTYNYNNFILGIKYSLLFINMLNKDNTLNNNANLYTGEKRFNIRYNIIKELKTFSLYIK